MNDFNLTQLDLNAMKQVDIQLVDPNTLVDINDIHIDANLPKEERQKEFVRQIKNPYCFKVGEIVVKISYADNGETFEQAMENYLQAL